MSESIKGAPIVGLVPTIYKQDLLLPAVDLSLDLYSQNVKISANNLLSPASIYDIGLFIPSNSLGSGSICYVQGFTQTVSFSSEFLGSLASAATAPASGAVFNIEKNNLVIGSVTFSAGSTVGVLATSIPGVVQFNLGDVFTVISPNPRDSTLNNVSITLVGY